VLLKLVVTKESISAHAARCSEHDVIKASHRRTSSLGTVDPVGQNEPEMLKPTSAIMGAGLKSVALITGRFSGGSHVGHATPSLRWIK
jgi:dihydroxyacid dehydratase/phosphogluconate dehydratase